MATKIIKSIITLAIMLFSITIFLAKPVIAENYKIGVVLPLSGDKAKTGQNLLNAIQLSVKQIKKEQDIDFELVVKDDKNDAAEAQKVAKELVQDPNLISIIGHYYSSTAMGATPIYDAAKIPTICIYASDPKVGESSPYVFSLNYSNQTQAEYMAVYIKEIFKKDNVLVVSNNDAFGLSLSDSFIKKAEKIGLTIFKHLEYDHVKKFENDFISSNLPDKELNKTIGAVVMFSHSDSGIKLVKQVREHGISANIIGPNPWSTHKFLDDDVIDEEFTRNVYVTSPFLWEIGNYRAFKFAEDFKASYKDEPNITAPMCYDAVFLLANAIKEKGAEKEKIKDFLASLTWQSAVAGITGNIFFNKSRMMDRDVFISEIKDGRFKVAYIQLLTPRETYVFKQKDERLKKGSLIEVDGQLYHWVDVVFIGVDFFRVNDVNTQKMNFDIEFYLWFKWMSDKVDISQVDILNAFSGTSTLIKEDLKRPVKYKCMRYKGSYVNPYDLSKFPFDTQSLPITLGHKSKNSTHIMIVPDARHMTHNPVREIYPQEWTYIDKSFNSGLHRFDSTFGDPDYRMGKGYKSKIYFSTMTVSIKLKRILFPYIFNIFVPLAIILTIAMLITRIPVEQFVLRTNLSMTSLLSILLYHMAQKNSLPRVGYLMTVDYYFITTYFFILLIIATNVITTMYIQNKKNETAIKINKRFQFIVIPLTLLVYAFVTIFL